MVLTDTTCTCDAQLPRDLSLVLYYVALSPLGEPWEIEVEGHDDLSRTGSDLPAAVSSLLDHFAVQSSLAPRLRRRADALAEALDKFVMLDEDLEGIVEIGRRTAGDWRASFRWSSWRQELGTTSRVEVDHEEVHSAEDPVHLLALVLRSIERATVERSDAAG